MNVTITTVLHFEGRDEPNALESTAVDITFAQVVSLFNSIFCQFTIHNTIFIYCYAVTKPQSTDLFQ